jgi:hypothetical protein
MLFVSVYWGGDSYLCRLSCLSDVGAGWDSDSIGLRIRNRDPSKGGGESRKYEEVVVFSE